MHFTAIETKLITLLTNLWHHLSCRRQRQFRLLLILVLVSSFAEVISLGAVLPFLGILSAPDIVFNHSLAVHVIQGWGITSPEQ